MDKEGVPVHPLKAWRTARKLTVREAAALIIVDGKAADGATWHAWERGRKIPKPAAMFEIERVTGLDPNQFYPRPDAGGAWPDEPAQLQLV